MTYGKLGQLCQEIANLVRMLAEVEPGSVSDKIKKEIAVLLEQIKE